MGGSGSTRWRGYQAAALVERTPRTSVDLVAADRGGPAAVLVAVVRDGETVHEQRVGVARRPLSRGGYAPRLVCECGRGVRFVYFIETDRRICCRKCGGLLHRSTRSSHDWGFEKIFKQIRPEGLTLRAFNQHFKRRR